MLLSQFSRVPTNEFCLYTSYQFWHSLKNPFLNFLSTPKHLQAPQSSLLLLKLAGVGSFITIYVRLQLVSDGLTVGITSRDVCVDEEAAKITQE
ncbi:hypothetical protein H5410_038335, partial [Solanum commersonii]